MTMTYDRKRQLGISTSGRDSNNNRINIVYQDGYKSLTDQLDLLWHDINNGKLGADAKTGAWYLDVKSVKERFPKT